MMYFRLKPSTIPDAGVGVFATAPIASGAVLAELFADDDIQTLTPAAFRALELPQEFHSLTICDLRKYHMPKHWNQVSVGWYLNHSDKPNLVRDDGYIYRAARDIAAGEELFIDYNAL